MRYYLFIFLYLLSSQLYGEEIPKKKVCLNMIVKNETKVIKRCLASVKPLIDYWVIVDTGSTDGTQEMIKEFLQDIAGELQERPWKNFEHNRNEALEFARGKADYILFMDADEFLEFEPDFKMPILNLDSYDSVIDSGFLQYHRIFLIKNGLDWKWHGVLHEYIGASKAKSKGVIPKVKKISRREGSRSSDPQKYQKDAKILEDALKEEPTNTRYMFYLAQSYRDAGDYESALKTYERRVKMGGWEEEVFYSMLQMARMQEFLHRDPPQFIKSYLAAFQYRPSRAEPLYYLAKYYRLNADHEKAFDAASRGLKIQEPKDILFVEKWIYDYGLKMEASISSYYVGQYELSQKLCQDLLANPNLPDNFRQMTKKNITFANHKIEEMKTIQEEKL